MVLEQGVGLPGSLWSGDTSKFNDSHSSPPSSSLAALNPRFNQVDKDAECGCVETMISSDQGGEGVMVTPPVVMLSWDRAESRLLAAHHCVCIESDL